MGINIGFTGTRDGMTVAQAHALRRRLTEFCSLYDVVYLHEGEGRDRNGGTESADFQAKRIAADLGCIIAEHRPRDDTAAALLDRDDDIVKKCSFLFAVPGGYEELTRSGTWYTVRQGRKAHRDGEIIWPCGCSDTGLSSRSHSTY